jgi:hypothetical protein
MAVWVGLKRQRGQRARRNVRLSDSLEHAFIRCLRERRGYRALSTPDVPFIAVSCATPLLVSLVMPGCADWLPVSLIAPVSVPAPPPVVVPASWLRSRPLQPARTTATRQAAACEVHRMGDTLSSEAFPMPGAFPILHPRGERNRQGRALR